MVKIRLRAPRRWVSRYLLSTRERTVAYLALAVLLAAANYGSKEGQGLVTRPNVSALLYAYACAMCLVAAYRGGRVCEWRLARTGVLSALVWQTITAAWADYYGHSNPTSSSTWVLYASVSVLALAGAVVLFDRVLYPLGWRRGGGTNQP